LWVFSSITAQTTRCLTGCLRLATPIDSLECTLDVIGWYPGDMLKPYGEGLGTTDTEVRSSDTVRGERIR
jgi:hypothetical protein